MSPPATVRFRTRLAALSGAVAVAAGAFGAHALADRVPPERLQTWETAARYHLIHAVLLLILARRDDTLAFRLIAAGTLIFAGSLYLLVLLDLPLLGAVTPVGGLCLIFGWIALARRSEA